MALHTGAEFFKKHRRCVWSVLSAVLLTVLCYFIDGSPYPAGGEMVPVQWVDRIRGILNPRPDHLPDSVLLVNVAYDKQLIPYSAPLSGVAGDDDRMPAGTIDVTDRRKLADFLQAASRVPYRCIMLDIRFDADVDSDPDAHRLFALIDSMPRVVYARHAGIKSSPDAPPGKGALSDYYTTMEETNMIKYPLVTGQGLSIPAHMYAQLQGGRFSTCCGIAVRDGRPAKKSIYLTYPVHIGGWCDTASPDREFFNYMNLGTDLLAMPDSAAWIAENVSSRIVVVGDFVNDIHETYNGPMPGALINLNAYIALCRGRDLADPWSTLLMGVLYALLTYLIVRQRPVSSLIPWVRRRQSAWLKFLLAFIGIATVLNLASALMYIAFGTIFSVTFPTFYFTLLDLWVQKRKS